MDSGARGDNNDAESRSRRPGPRRSLDTGDIVAVAVGLADAQGLDAVTMRSVAAEVGVTAAALYRYFPSREVLLTHMIDAASAEVQYPEPGGRPLEDVVAVAESQREVFAAHRWLGPAVSSHSELGPVALDHVETMLRILEPLGAGTREQLETIGLVSALAASFANSRGPVRGMDSLRPGRYPLLAGILREAAPEPPAPDLFPRAVAALATGVLGSDLRNP